MDALRAVPTTAPLRRASTASERATIRLEFSQDEKTAHNLRLLMNSFVLLSSGDKNLASRMTVAAAQLSENALKRSRATRFMLQLHFLPSTGLATMELSNEATESEVQSLRKSLEQVNKLAPAEAYSQALVSTDPDAESRLCLARVRYEGQLALSMWRDSNRVVLVAEASVNP